MELWIRSQDRKQLTKTTNLEVDFNEYSEPNQKWRIVSRLGIDHYNSIGGYETEERALEVLEEIQDYINGIKKDWNMGIGNFYSNSDNSKVYEMPKE